MPDRSDGDLEQLHERLERLETKLEHKDERIQRLERKTDRLEADRDRLEADRDQLTDTVADLQQRVADLETKTSRLETTTDRLESLANAACKKATANKERIAELQSRELEKGAHLRVDSVDEHAISVADGRLERIEKDDGNAYYRLPESADPLERGGDVSLAYGDLLPIQQLARMDEDMRRSAASSLPTRLAATLWQARTDPSVGDNPWNSGCKDVAEYVTASDLKHWIRRQETGISESYAKKLVSRTIDAILELSRNRLAVRRTTQRANGLEYTERRVVLPDDAAIPGTSRQTAQEPSADTDPDPETTDVHG
ncbi:hypothetical protein [Natronolimnobius baerhuensis]|uniref:Uncharacterized protein n=1 Tax=Natronolimnobius baerhuensis TaxID=253108 RepID=A0A202EDQ8_9EURY|nr:hypothetical protein [Natronolimnobius baerhuensis]OVE86130.1 hypothetical protein B2G88_04885 [Natronolimnobius baerhuensis]